MATGEIVAWLNSDDVYLPGAIHQAVEALERAGTRHGVRRRDHGVLGNGPSLRHTDL